MSEYKSEIKDMVWSYSRLTTFARCKYEFYLKYIVADDTEYLAEQNYYAELGGYVHEILAMIFDGKLSIDEASQYFVDNYDSNVFYKTKQSTMDKNFENCANYFSEVDFSWLNDYEILGVEKEVKFTINKYDFIGYIDLLLRDKRDGRIVLIDNKSSEYPFRKDGKVKAKLVDTFDKYKKQMYLYCYAIEKEYGEFPKEITWNHFQEGGKFAIIPFSKEEYDESIKWFIDNVKIIEKEKDYEPSEDYFYCHNLCDFRNSCEYKVASS